MAFKRLNDLKLIEEYCCKPVNETCPIHKTYYDNEFQCRYWKQVWKQHDDFNIRQGSHWYKAMRGENICLREMKNLLEKHLTVIEKIKGIYTNGSKLKEKREKFLKLSKSLEELQW